MATTFATALGSYLAEQPKKTVWQKRLQKILDAKGSARRSRFLKILEDRARAQLGVGAEAAIDWSSINWSELLSAILKFLLLLLPLFL